MSTTRLIKQSSRESTIEQIETEFEAFKTWIYKKCKESKYFRYFIGAIKGGAPAVGSVLGGAALVGLSLSGVGVILIAIAAFIGATIWKSRKILKEIKALEDSAEKTRLMTELTDLKNQFSRQGQDIRHLQDRYERLLEHNPTLNPHSLDNTVDGPKVELEPRKKGAPDWAAYQHASDSNNDDSQLLTARPISAPAVTLGTSSTYLSTDAINHALISELTEKEKELRHRGQKKVDTIIDETEEDEKIDQILMTTLSSLSKKQDTVIHNKPVARNENTPLMLSRH